MKIERNSIYRCKKFGIKVTVIDVFVEKVAIAQCENDDYPALIDLQQFKSNYELIL